MLVPKPTLPPYDPLEWQRKPWPEKLRMVCDAWAMQGYGAPSLIYVVYLLKICLYIWAWCFFCSFTPGLGDIWSISSWWFAPIAFQKAILWSMAYEGLGLGCGSGPLTGRYFPPLGGVLYFVRPGTIKMPLFPGLPVLGGTRRTILDVALYLAHYVFLFRALMAPKLTFSLLLPMVILLPVLCLTDKTIFLASRSEHYYTTMICFLFLSDWIAGSKAVQLAIWWWAATSKFNRHFPAVVCVMTSNSPVLRFRWLRKAMYRDYPNDLRPSNLARFFAHFGTVVELTFPLLLVFGAGGWPTTVGLIIMLLFHTYITSNFPMAVPIEWNVMVVYGAFFLFGHHSGIPVWSIQSPLLIVFLLVMLVVVPLLGNLFPHRISFLSSMRYYAGNWAYSVWLFKEGSSEKLDQCLTKMSPSVTKQLRMFYDEATSVALLSKVLAFRAMHLHGRALQLLLPKAIDIERFHEYEYLDGEIVAGVVLGWNFGDGHLHNEQLLQAIQQQCNFAQGELRCIFVESQPMGSPSVAWRIVDAKQGLLEQGEIVVRELEALQPWPVA